MSEKILWAPVSWTSEIEHALNEDGDNTLCNCQDGKVSIPNYVRKGIEYKKCMHCLRVLRDRRSDV
jgi:hypothetical protein